MKVKHDKNFHSRHSSFLLLLIWASSLSCYTYRRIIERTQFDIDYFDWFKVEHETLQVCQWTQLTDNHKNFSLTNIQNILEQILTSSYTTTLVFTLEKGLKEIRRSRSKCEWRIVMSSSLNPPIIFISTLMVIIMSNSNNIKPKNHRNECQPPEAIFRRTFFYL